MVMMVIGRSIHQVEEDVGRIFTVTSEGDYCFLPLEAAVRHEGRPGTSALIPILRHTDRKSVV